MNSTRHIFIKTPPYTDNGDTVHGLAGRISQHPGSMEGRKQRNSSNEKVT
ncbi:hypothetical protein [Desulfobotulus mexicanus]|nr:hypothetical protein [Desulfobotulus mexicanus]